MEYMHNEAGVEQKPHSEVEEEKKSKPKEEGDWTRPIGRSPLSMRSGVYYNICNGQVAPDTVNVQKALATRSEQNSEFHKAMKRRSK